MKILRAFSILLLLILFFSNNYSQTLREKIGQMVWTSFTGTKINDTIKVDLQKRNLGGLVLFAANITSPSQIKQLNDSIKSYAKTPVFIAVDQEGGKIARLSASNGFASTYSAYKLGTVFNKEDSTRRTASTMAGWLKQSGFNVDLAPVADVNVNPNSPAIGKLERSFSNKPDSVYWHIKWFSDEFNKKGIVTCLKHFPGHGSALQDSHLGFTDISNTWSTNELIPYQSLIAENFNNMVMIGHLYNYFLDEYYPASLSKKVTTDLLRNDLGFKGVTITDAMAMQAITANYSFEDAVELAVNAGNNIILYTSTLRYNTSLTQQVIDIILTKIDQGKIPVSRIEESYNRIINLKKSYGVITNVEQFSGNSIPNDFDLYQNYPNPFNPETTISYNLSKDTFVSLKIYDVLGREVTTLADEIQRKGLYNYKFGIDNLSLASGIYYYRLSTPGLSQTRKMIYIK